MSIIKPYPSTITSEFFPRSGIILWPLSLQQNNLFRHFSFYLLPRQCHSVRKTLIYQISTFRYETLIISSFWTRSRGRKLHLLVQFRRGPCLVPHCAQQLSCAAHQSCWITSPVIHYLLVFLIFITVLYDND